MRQSVQPAAPLIFLSGCRTLAAIAALWPGIPAVLPAAEPGESGFRPHGFSSRTGPNPGAQQRAPAGSIVIEGLETVSPEEAAKSIVLQRRFVEANGVTTARADDAAFFLETDLRKRGLMKARVDWRIDGTRIVLSVNEGEVMLIGDVAVTGNTHLSTAAVRELATARTRERFAMPADAPDVPYVLADVTAASKEIARLYGRLGYRDVKVEQGEPRIRGEENRVDLSFQVTEGRLYRVGDIVLPPLPEGMESETLAGIGDEFRGKPFTDAVTANLVDRVVTAGREAGYFDAAAEATAEEPQRISGETGAWRLDLSVQADWGSRFTFAGLRVDGLERVRPEIIERRFQRLSGEPYSPAAVNEMTADFLKIGAFESLTAQPVPREDDTIVLDVEAIEGDRQRVGPYFGFDSYLEQIVGLEYRNVNTFGRLHALDAQIEYSGRGFRGEVNYLDPWFHGTDWELSLGMFSLTRQNEGYKIFESGIPLGLTRKFGKDKRHEFNFRIRPSYTDVTDFDIEPQFIGNEQYLDVPLTLGYTLSLVDNKEAPARGFIFDAGLSGAGAWSGSNIDYTRARTRLAYYRPFGKTSLRLGARAGVIWPADDLDFPINLRYFSGGASSVRSFPERELGPRDKFGYPVGGEFFTTFNAEYHIPVWGPVTLAPFFDAGNLLPSSEDASLDDMHYAGGLSLILKSPIGPLRIDYGQNLNPGSGGPSGTWHFGFGFAF